jgi:endonuclease/exonuclease/phosphatase family metal-dependent hydrolase
MVLLGMLAAGLPAKAEMIRAATFNCSLTRSKPGALIEDLAGGNNPQAKAAAEIMQRVRPDVVLLNELDWDAEGKAVSIFQKEYLEVPQNEQEPLAYPFVFTAPVNTGLSSGLDLDGDGRTDGPEDAFGYGRFEGQYGMVLLSRFPIRTGEVRTFQKFLWKDMPGALLPRRPGEGDAMWYSPEALQRLRLSSKSHWDVPVEAGGRVIHFLASHPTPPVFDGAEDRNGRRNHDEIRFWADYLRADRSGYIYDDAGRRGGLEEGALFVIVGDLNADPADGDGRHEGILSLLNHSRVQDLRPSSKGAAEAARLDGGVNERHKGPAELDTYQSVPGREPGNLRLDYVLPSKELTGIKAGVFWPERADPLSRLTAGPPYVSSDHRLVWADIELP